MKTLVRFFIGLFLLVYSSQMYAQKQIGPALTYGTEIDRVGLVLNANIQINDTWELSPSFTFYFPKTYDFVTTKVSSNMFALDVDAHYLFQVSEFKLYPLGGLNFTYATSKISHGEPLLDDPLDTDSIVKIGLNLGGGASYPFSDRLTGFGEFKFTLNAFERISLTTGLLFNL